MSGSFSPPRKPAGGSIALVVFDLDGVLLDFHPEGRLAYLARHSGLAPAAIHDAIWGSPFEREAEAGAYPTGEAYLAEFNRRLGHALTREEWIAARSAAMTARPEMLSLVRRLHGFVRLGILTNNGALLGESLPLLIPELYDLCQGACHATSEFRARKPDPLVYQRLVAYHGLAPTATVFVDDDPGNVAGAVAAGLHGIVFRDAGSLLTELTALLPDLR